MNGFGWKWFLLMVGICLVIQGIFAMAEMACVSLNRVRLQYYVTKGSRRAIWLTKLLQSPGRLFGTALICVNAALQLGSECARRFYESVGLSPDFAPFTQVVIVLVFAEIAPLFAGRRYAEHAALFSAPILYGASILLAPLIWLFDLFCRLVHRMIGSVQSQGFYLTREELQKILEEQDEEEFNTIVKNIFSLKLKTAKEFMKPLSSIQSLPALCTVAEMRTLLSSQYSPYVPVYHKTFENIVGIAFPRDLLRQAEHKKIRDYARSPWFITEKDSISSILRQFRRNNQSIAIVLNEKGTATGILTLDEIIDEIFGQKDQWLSMEEVLPRIHDVVVDRTFSGDLKIEDFNAEYGANLDRQGKETLSQLMAHLLGHLPVQGESVRIDRFELTVEEASLLGAKTISVRTL